MSLALAAAPFAIAQMAWAVLGVTLFVLTTRRFERWSMSPAAGNVREVAFIGTLVTFALVWSLVGLGLTVELVGWWMS